MIYLICAWIWCGILTEILLRQRTKFITRDPENRIDLPFKSRILGTDKIERNTDSIHEERRIRIFSYVGCLFLTILVGPVFGSHTSNFAVNILIMFGLSTLGALIGGSICLLSLKKP